MITLIDHDPNDTSSINITPLIDVVFILLIFFLLTANTSRGIVLDLPAASTGETIAIESWELVITKDEEILFNGVTIEKDHLESVLNTAKKQDNEQRLIMLKAHKEASVNSFISVMDTVRKTGFYNLVIATSIKADEH
ncbi:ExbD/TolR family protein [Thalassotalea piscium]